MKIDVHNHTIPDTSLDLLRSDPIYRVTVDGDRISGGNRPPFTLVPAFNRPAAKLADLERRGLDGAVISSSPSLFYYEVEVKPQELMARATNQGLEEFCRQRPDRFRWMANLPMMFPERAIAVLDDAARAGCVGVEVGTSIAGRRLDEPDYEVFWAAVDRLRLPVMIHPIYNEPNRALEPYYLQNVIGNQLETTIAIERLICAGVLDRHPGVTVLLVHGGGYFPYQAGRLRHARTVRPELAQAPADPWKYVGQICFDCLTHDREALRYLVSRVGAENVLMGTDAPFDMASPDPMKALLDAVDEQTARRIAQDNPARVFHFVES